VFLSGESKDRFDILDIYFSERGMMDRFDIKDIYFSERGMMDRFDIKDIFDRFDIDEEHEWL